MSHGSGRLVGGQEARVVQFYPADGRLGASVSRCLAGGIRSGDGVVVVAMEPYRNAYVAPAAGGMPWVADARSFPCELDSVRAARHYVADLLEPAADEALAADVAIAVTELAANAVVHSRSAFTVIVSRWAASIRIAVRDNVPVAREARGHVPAPRDRSGESVRSVPFPVTTGHGLSVVAKLASRWGVEPTPAGKVVWAELGAC